tara:strand:+ start:2346 stop:2507 length:162 start_codon:yes stop_codon:yes gene_type:complete
MNDTLVTTRGEAKEKEATRSYMRCKKVQKAIAKASNNGRCWWIEQYLKNSIKY